MRLDILSVDFKDFSLFDVYGGKSQEMKQDLHQDKGNKVWDSVTIQLVSVSIALILSMHSDDPDKGQLLLLMPQP